ncbi:MAG TPA: HAMP domain-containing sensor histidine kinase, partial [Spirochaetia bacterium]|nr:HAMP domain-containing sensor histidine kinase [Spirochaetia bacterium]
TLPYSLETLKCPDLISLCTSALEAQSSPLILSKEILLRDSAYMVIVSPVIETSGETAGVVVVLRDITALKKLETAKSMFVSMVAHEVKSPLAVAEGYLNLILSDKVQDEPEQRKKMLERSLLRIKTLRLMVSELLNLTAIETGNFTLKRSLMDIRKITAEAVNTCREMAEEKKITLTLESDDTAELEKVFADPDAMRIVLKNLIENAVKYTSDGGCVSVHVGKTGVFAKIKVKDNGIGIKPEDREKIFEEFYRAKNRHTAGIPGTGLGLSLVKRLLDLQHGRISVESTPEKGSEFTVSLPLTA